MVFEYNLNFKCFTARILFYNLTQHSLTISTILQPDVRKLSCENKFHQSEQSLKYLFMTFHDIFVKLKNSQSMAKGHLFTSCRRRWIQKKLSKHSKKSVNFTTKEGIERGKFIRSEPFCARFSVLLRLSSVRKSLQQFRWKIDTMIWISFWLFTRCELNEFHVVCLRAGTTETFPSSISSEFVIWSAKAIFQLQMRFACFTSIRSFSFPHQLRAIFNSQSN